MSHHKSDPNKSVSLTIDGYPVVVPEGTTILEAARKANIKIPTLCDHPDLGRRAVCRLCVVECDGRGKLLAACANEVWEGVSVVTNNARLIGIRKMILELILANHPPECLSCIRNMHCELQNLAAEFGIRSSPFRRDALDQGSSRHFEEMNETLVRDMDKCVKCGRCVDVCQEIQSVRAINSSHRSGKYGICTPFDQTLSSSHCIFCGQCAAVCPVGAIYEHDEIAEIWSALGDEGQSVVAQIAPSVAPAVCREFGLPAGSITTGKLVAAMNQMGFSMVLDAGIFAEMTIVKEANELSERIKSTKNSSGKALPLISCCSPGWIKFVEEFYPDLTDHLPVSENPERNFKASVKERFSHSSFMGKSKVTFVSVMPCIAKKISTRLAYADNVRDKGIVLSPRELARMIRMAGIDMDTLPESRFGSFPGSEMAHHHAAKSGPTGVGTLLWNIYEAYDAEKGSVNFLEENHGIKEVDLKSDGTKVKALVVNGFANARIVMDSIREGKCDAALVGIMACPGVCGSSHGGGSQQ